MHTRVSDHLREINDLLVTFDNFRREIEFCANMVLFLGKNVINRAMYHDQGTIDQFNIVSGSVEVTNGSAYTIFIS